MRSSLKLIGLCGLVVGTEPVLCEVVCTVSLGTKHINALSVVVRPQFVNWWFDQTRRFIIRTCRCWNVNVYKL